MKQDYHSYQTCHFYLLGCTGGGITCAISFKVLIPSLPQPQNRTEENIYFTKSNIPCCGVPQPGRPVPKFGTVPPDPAFEIYTTSRAGYSLFISDADGYTGDQAVSRVARQADSAYPTAATRHLTHNSKLHHLIHKRPPLNLPSAT